MLSSCQLTFSTGGNETQEEKDSSRSRVTIKHRRSLDRLFPFLVAPLALEQVVSLTRSVHEREQLFHVFSRKVSTNVGLLVDDTRREVLFVGLSLEDCERRGITERVSHVRNEYKSAIGCSLFSSTVPVATKR